MREKTHLDSNSASSGETSVLSGQSCIESTGKSTDLADVAGVELVVLESLMRVLLSYSSMRSSMAISSSSSTHIAAVGRFFGSMSQH